MENNLHVLRVAFPRACNTQQTASNHATTSATATQHAGLKALAHAALVRNNTRNNRATSSPGITQQADIPQPLVGARKRGLMELVPEAVAALESFVDLVRVTAACDHQILLHRDEIEHELDDADVRELLNTDRLERQSWAALLAYRLSMARKQRGPYKRGSHGC